MENDDLVGRQLRSRRIGLVCLGLTAIGWGLNWPIIKLVLREWPPLSARGTAGLAAALGLAAVAAMRGERLTVPPRALRRLSTAAALNVFAWMGFSYGLRLKGSAGIPDGWG